MLLHASSRTQVVHEMDLCSPDPGCSPKHLKDRSLRGMVRFYIAKCRPHARAELDEFRVQPTNAAVQRAALCLDELGKRFSHQRRMKGPALRKSEEILCDSVRELRACRSFDELHELVRHLLEGIVGLGSLYYYDTALRIGANLKVMPRRVYLHRGTRKGARALCLDWQIDTLNPRSLPKELWVLEPHEIEDFLCIFKDRLRKAMGSPRAGVGSLSTIFVLWALLAS